MKAFRFSLESVLVLRQRQEKVATGNYAQSLLALQQAFERAELVRQELNVACEELREQMLAGCIASQAIHAYGYLDSLEKNRQKCVAEISAAERRKTMAMQAMLAARQRREVVDKFFQREKKRYDYDLSREEQKMMDDLPQRRVASPLSWNPSETLA